MPSPEEGSTCRQSGGVSSAALLGALISLVAAHSVLADLPSGLPHTPRASFSRVGFALPWLSATQMLLFLIFAVRLFRTVILRRLMRSATLFSESELDDKALDIVDAELSPSLSDVPARAAHALIALYVASRPLGIGALDSDEAWSLFVGVFAWRVLSVVWRLLRMLCVDGLPRSEFGRTKDLDETSVLALLRVGRVVYWVFSFVVVAENVGLKIGSLVASAGVGGIALGLAAQQILQDLLAALTMMLDKTLCPGDFVSIGNDIFGTVVSRGWKSTRVMSPNGDMVVVSNHDVSNARIRTFKSVMDRREVLALFVDIETDLARLRRVATLLENAVRGVDGDKKAVFSACYLKKFEESRIVFELVVEFPGTKLDEYRHLLHGVNMAVADVFANNAIKFAVPYRKSI